MKKLNQLAKKLKDNNFIMTEEIKDEFEEFLSIIAEDSRIFHPRFGIGTVRDTQGNAWVGVEFDNDNINFKQRLKDWEKSSKYSWNKPKKYKRYVHITSCISAQTMIKKLSMKPE